MVKDYSVHVVSSAVSKKLASLPEYVYDEAVAAIRGSGMAIVMLNKEKQAVKCCCVRTEVMSLCDVPYADRSGTCCMPGAGSTGQKVYVGRLSLRWSAPDTEAWDADFNNWIFNTVRTNVQTGSMRAIWWDDGRVLVHVGEKQDCSGWLIGIAMGFAIGMAMGVAMKNIGTGLCMGLCFASSYGLLFSNARNQAVMVQPDTQKTEDDNAAV